MLEHDDLRLNLAREPGSLEAERHAAERPSRSNRGDNARVMPSANASAVGSDTSTPVTSSTTVSSAPHLLRATTGAAAGLRFDGHDAEVFLARHQHHAGAAIQIPKLSVGLASRETASRSPSRAGPLEARALGTVADDAQGHLGLSAGLDGDMYLLVGDQSGHHERPPFGHRSVDVVELGVDGWIHNSGLAIIVSADPPRNVL